MGWLPVPQFSTHTTRHLCLTDLARMGWQLHAIATFAGHRSTESTLTYIHLSGGYPAGCRTSRPCGAELLQRLGNHLRAVVHAPHLRRAARRGENALKLGDEPLDHRRCASCTARTSWPRRVRRARRSPAELKVSAATLYSWRRSYGGMDTDAATALTELREQNARLKRSLAEAELAAMCLIVPSSPILGPQDSKAAGLIHREQTNASPLPGLGGPPESEEPRASYRNDTSTDGEITSANQDRGAVSVGCASRCG